MSIIIENEYKGTIDIPYEKIAEEVIAAAIDYENCPYECEVNLLLTDNEEIHRINLEQRQIDRPTDVLSFQWRSMRNRQIFLIWRKIRCFLIRKTGNFWQEIL